MNVISLWFTRFWLNTLASTALVFGLKKRALEIYRQIATVAPRDEASLCAVGTMLMDDGDVAGAIDVFLRLLEINPRNAEAWFDLGYIYEQRGDDHNAERCFRESIALKPELDRAWYGLALVLIRRNRLREAVDALTHNTELQPFSPYGWYQLAMTHHHLGEIAKAWRVQERLAGFEPKYAAALKRDLEQVAPRAASPHQAVPTTT